VKAIVLTFDNNRAFAINTIEQYYKKWRTNNFIFHVPYQERLGDVEKRFHGKVEMVRSHSAIKETVITLLSDIPDNEWVYWCIDDKYLIGLYDFILADKIHQWVEGISDTEIAGISMCRCRNLLKDAHLHINEEPICGPDNTKFLRRRDYSQIWLHQYVRAKVIKDLFRNFPAQIPRAKMMDSYVKHMKLPQDYKLYVSEKNYTVFGESARDGRITRNCLKEMKKSKITIDKNLELHNKDIIIGKIEKKRKVRIFLRRLTKSIKNCKDFTRHYICSKLLNNSNI